MTATRYAPPARRGFTGPTSGSDRPDPVRPEWVLSWAWLAVLAVIAAQWPALATPLRLTLYLVIAYLFLTNADRLVEPIVELTSGLVMR